MTDARLRELHRRATHPEARAELLRERLRLGLDLGAVRVTTLCGDPTWQETLALLPELLETKAEVAELFDVSPSTIAGWCRKGCPHERVGRARRFDLGRVHAWRVADAWSWAIQSGLETFAAIAARCAGEAVALRALIGAAGPLRSRLSAALEPETARVAEALLDALETDGDVGGALDLLKLRIPAGVASWATDAFRTTLPLTLLAAAHLAPPERTLPLAQRAARALIPALKLDADNAHACADEALAAGRAALLAWARSTIDAHDPLNGVTP